MNFTSFRENNRLLETRLQGKEAKERFTACLLVHVQCPRSVHDAHKASSECLDALRLKIQCPLWRFVTISPPALPGIMPREVVQYECPAV